MLIFKTMNIRKSIYTISIGLLSFSCQDVLEKFPLDKPDNSTFLKNTTELDLAVNGVYNRLWLSNISAAGQWETFVDCATDIAWDRNASVLTFAGNGTLNSANGTVAEVWQHFYEGIGRANYVLDNLSKVEGASPTQLSEAEGQVRFLRAYWYSQLVTLFGDVPLIQSVQGINDIEVARNPKKEVIDFILADLDNAASSLPKSWPAAGSGKATSGAALALKARVALYDGRYDIAAQASKAVIDAGTYSLYDEYEDLFTYKGENNKEIIMQVQYTYGHMIHRSPVANFSRNSQGNSTKVPTQSLVDSYECLDGLTIDKSPMYDPKNPWKNRDPRLRYTVALPGDTFLGFQFETHKDSLQCWNYSVSPARRVANQDATNPYASFTGYCWRKTTDPADLGAFRSASSLNSILIRLAEVNLTYAEAKIELNQIDASVLQAINAVRGRASVKMPAIEAGKSQAEMREIIRRERKIELALEGLRLADIRRWKIAEKVMPGPLYGRPNKPYSYKDQGVPRILSDGSIDYSGYSDKLTVVEPRLFDPNRDYLWPIPLRELDANKKLIQNPNY
jgi:hypothetical protein